MPSVAPILDGELLRALDAFATTLNFTHAAARIHLSQPAMHERIQRLAAAAGAALYVRAGRSLVLTETGRALAAFARETLERADAFQREIGGQARRATVTLAAGEGALLYFLGP